MQGDEIAIHSRSEMEADNDSRSKLGDHCCCLAKNSRLMMALYFSFLRVTFTNPKITTLH